jgi:hypothetical protein
MRMTMGMSINVFEPSKRFTMPYVRERLRFRDTMPLSNRIKRRNLVYWDRHFAARGTVAIP